ncbi:MAG: hypothetical protein N3A58_03315 [Spirochaetes bacterium]|nr:hypothetical protein [Spirochaetota bacterium]
MDPVAPRSFVHCLFPFGSYFTRNKSLAPVLFSLSRLPPVQPIK